MCRLVKRRAATGRASRHQGHSKRLLHSQPSVTHQVAHSSTPATMAVWAQKESNHSLVGSRDTQEAKVCSLGGGREKRGWAIFGSGDVDSRCSRE